MSSVLPALDRSASTPDPQAQTSKSQRVLACVLCQQRKVKCDRTYPCANCIRSRTQCIPATLATRRRRRKFPERDLLERLRKYENLLRRNNIKFEPLPKDVTGERETVSTRAGNDSNDEQPETAEFDWSSPSTIIKSERVYETKYALSKKLNPLH